MGKKINIYLPLFFALTLIIGVLLGNLLLPHAQKNIFSLNLNRYDKLNDVLNYIENDYVDTISRKTLIEKGIAGLLQSLDPHSGYIKAEEFNESNDPLKGNFDGIGIQFRVIHDTITVINTIQGGPSEKEGILSGDRIVKINEKNATGIKIKDTEVMKQLKGRRGTQVAVKVYRKDEKKYYDFTITRDVIPTYSVDIAYMINYNTGYIKLSKFSASTATEVHEALKKLKSLGMEKLVFDLRSNGGGYLDEAIEIADEFLPENKMIVYTEGSHRSKRSYVAKGGGLFEQNDLVVLIDEFSASASEIVAGAVQDNDRGTIIGRRSFGKGLVQEQILLGDGSAIRLTVARYHTPTGRCIQKPYTKGYEEYYNEFYIQLLEDNMNVVDSLNFADTIRYKTPGGKIVYGGGGIMPDIYIPYKAEFISDYYRKIISKDILRDFCFDYADKNRNQLKKYGSAEKFVSSFIISNGLFEEFIAYAESKGVARDNEGIKSAENALKSLIKGSIGRNIFDDPAFYPVILHADIMFKKAMQVLEAR